jgi:hypothetical protein
MNMENNNEMTGPVEEKEPIYFHPKRVSLVSDFASILSWVVLVGFIGDFILKIISLQDQIKTNDLVLSTLMKDPSFFGYLFINLIVPILTGLGLFAILQAAAAGLNVLLENDYNAREAKSKAKA